MEGRENPHQFIKFGSCRRQEEEAGGEEKIKDETQSCLVELGENEEAGQAGRKELRKGWSQGDGSVRKVVGLQRAMAEETHGKDYVTKKRAHYSSDDEEEYYRPSSSWTRSKQQRNLQDQQADIEETEEAEEEADAGAQSSAEQAAPQAEMGTARQTAQIEATVKLLLMLTKSS